MPDQKITDREALKTTGRSELPTLEDVAAVAGVSTATVSRCLNRPEVVSEATRSRVLQAVTSIGYSPNFGAKAMAARRTDTFGAIVPTMENAIFARGLQAFEEELVANGATLLVASFAYDPVVEEQQIRTMIMRGADGLLLIGRRRRKEIYEFLERQKVSVVLSWTSARQGNLSSVGFDNAAGSRALAERAIELGHRRFVCISAPRKNNDRARDRVTGVRRALAKHGIDESTLAVIEVPYHIRDAGEAFRKIMVQQPVPTIVMCGNDVQAVGAVLMARELGLRVPDDVSITGFDDIEIASIVQPGLTTVHVPHREMGKRAAQSMMSQMRGEAHDLQVKLRTHIVERESLGPAAGKPYSPT